MKIDRTKLRRRSSEVPPECKALIDKLKSCNHDELLEELSNIKTWNCGKSKLYHWVDILNAFDYTLEIACEKVRENQWYLPCDEPGQGKHKQLLLCMLQFTALLVEHSFSWHFYNSMEHLTVLLSSSDMNVVLAVLNLLYAFSKRSNFITRLNADLRQILLPRLLYLAENWGGKENGFGLAECCQNLPVSAYPASASTMHFEYYAENRDEKVLNKASNTIIAIHMDNVDQIPDKTPSQIMEELIEKYSVPEDKQMQLFTHVRLAHSFSDYSKRILCVQARLQALSVLVYCHAVPDNLNSLLNNGLIEELMDVLELQDPNLIEIKAAAVRTLSAMVHFDRNAKLNAVIDATGAASYNGYLPVLVRNCIQSLTDPELKAFPLPFATALLSFLYHLASYKSGADALVSCGMMEALFKVINWHSTETENISFVKRAVHVIDLISYLDMEAFQTHGGLASFIQRLEVEVSVCRQDQPFVINPKLNETIAAESPNSRSLTLPFDPESEMDVDLSPHNRTMESDNDIASDTWTGVQCIPRRAALLKSMLTFLKKSIQDPAFSDNIQHLMDGSLPNSLKHIIGNAEYYGRKLVLLAANVVIVYVFQKPALLPLLQDNGLTDVVLYALLIKEVPTTREVLALLPKVFSALCLNARGLQSFVACKPFEKLFRVLVSSEYLPAMRRRRSSASITDAASKLGNAVDKFMQHQLSLRNDATSEIIKLLEVLCAMGRDPRYICSRPTARLEIVAAAVTRVQNVSNDTGSTPVQGPLPRTQSDRNRGMDSNGTNYPMPLVDYILNMDDSDSDPEYLAKVTVDRSRKGIKRRTNWEKNIAVKRRRRKRRQRLSDDSSNKELPNTSSMSNLPSNPQILPGESGRSVQNSEELMLSYPSLITGASTSSNDLYSFESLKQCFQIMREGSHSSQDQPKNSEPCYDFRNLLPRTSNNEAEEILCEERIFEPNLPTDVLSEEQQIQRDMRNACGSGGKLEDSNCSDSDPELLARITVGRSRKNKRKVNGEKNIAAKKRRKRHQRFSDVSSDDKPPNDSLPQMKE